MDINELRIEIDKIDDELICLFEKRMEISGKIAKYKKEKGIPVFDPDRELQKFEDIALKLPDDLKEYGKELYSTIFYISREKQNALIDSGRITRTEDTLRCGLLGRKLGHSYSPQIHAMLGDYQYELYEKEPEELGQFLQEAEFDGINVTIPYKKNIIPYCRELSDTAKKIGSVNTIIRMSDGSLFGDNTDAFGFEKLIKKTGISPNGKKALVLGSGGASATVCAVLNNLRAKEIVVISRTGKNNYDHIGKHYDADLIVNTTPVGMYPDNGRCLINLSDFKKLNGVLDVVYNPSKTALLLQAERLNIPCGGGLYMLVAQAKRSSELFSGKKINDNEIDRIESVIRKEMQNIILIGMPGSGKSTCAKALGKILSREVIDTDSEIELRSEFTIPEIFEKNGEVYFRKLESAVLNDVCKSSGKIIATGGGCVTQEENYTVLRQNSVIVWIKRDLNLLPLQDRPISLKSNMEELFKKRCPLYEKFSDIAVDNNGSISETLSRIMEAIQ